jgi:hypothetical protein
MTTPQTVQKHKQENPKYITNEHIEEPEKSWYKDKAEREDHLIQRKKFMLQEARK